MTNLFNGIREFKEDDVEKVAQMLQDNELLFIETKVINSSHSIEELKYEYCNGDPYSKGFIFLDEGKIVAFAGVIPSQVSKNGILTCGALKNHEHVINELIEQCLQVIRQYGGEKIYTRTFTKFGQIRNKAIKFWERLGFISDEYSNISTGLNLEKWQEPDDFDGSYIRPAMDFELADIVRILMEDKEDKTAETIRAKVEGKHLDYIILTLRDKVTDEIVGLSYYVIRVDQALNDGVINYRAVGFGVHLRPKFASDIGEHRRLIQAALLSMKQLNIKIVLTHITLKNFDVFVAMIMEGFHERYLELDGSKMNVAELHDIRLYKSVYPE